MNFACCEMKFMRVMAGSFRRPGSRSISSANPGISPTRTSKTSNCPGPDKQNVETIVAYENKIHDELGSKPITRTLLDGLFIEDAVKMRQEIYARRGKVFTKEPWFQTYFESFAWYKANPSLSMRS